MRQLLLTGAIALALQPLPADARETRGLATVYGYPGDRYGGTGRVGCPGEALRRYGSRSLAIVRQRAMERDGLYVVAMRHEYGRCGRIVEVRHRNSAWLAAIILDRGPYSCYKGTRRVTALRCRPGWSRKSLLDMPTEMAERLGHNGLARVSIRARHAAVRRDPTANSVVRAISHTDQNTRASETRCARCSPDTSMPNTVQVGKEESNESRLATSCAGRQTTRRAIHKDTFENTASSWSKFSAGY